MVKKNFCTSSLEYISQEAKYPLMQICIITHLAILKTNEMRPQEKGLTNKDIERILNFDWDVFRDDELDDISAMLERNFKGIVKRGKSIEIGLLDNILANKSEQEFSGAGYMCFEKIDPKSLKWRSRPFEAPDTILEDDNILEVHAI